MRNFVPYWCNGAAVKTPDGKPGTTYDAGPYDGYEWVEKLGRGIAKIRPTNYSQYAIWGKCGNDLRHNETTGSIYRVLNTTVRHRREAARRILAHLCNAHL